MRAHSVFFTVNNFYSDFPRGRPDSGKRRAKATRVVSRSSLTRFSAYYTSKNARILPRRSRNGIDSRRSMRAGIASQIQTGAAALRHGNSSPPRDFHNESSGRRMNKALGINSP